METDTVDNYLLKALNAFPRKIAVISPDFKILATRGSIIGAEQNNFIGQKCHSIFFDKEDPCEDCPTKQIGMKQKLKTGQVLTGKLDEKKMPCVFSYPIFTTDGEIEAFVMMDFGLPRLNHLEEKLEHSNALLGNLINSSVIAVIAADMEGKTLIFNEAASQISGYSIKEALQSLDIRDLYPGNGAQKVMTKLRSEEYGGKGILKSYKADFKRKNGESIPIVLNAAIVYEKWKESATVGFFHDLREELKIKKELEKTQVQLLQSEKMASLGKLAAGVAHQLNNPLGGITLFTKLILEEYELEDNLKDDLHRILEDALRCRDTVKELLEFSRQTRYLVHPQDINKTLSRTLFLLENQTLFHNIKIIKKLSPELPWVPADIQQLNHLFMNIILNGAQAMDGKGRLTVTTRLRADKKCVSIEIADTGPGIAENILPHLFEPFFTTKEEGKGTGLGLSLVYGIVENHGGTITAANNLDKGASFIIRLPLAKDKNKGDERGK